MQKLNPESTLPYIVAVSIIGGFALAVLLGVI